MSDRARDRVMALDVGGRRTGVAVSDELGILASPVGFVERNDRDRVAFLEIVRRWGITHMLVGLPTSMSGREGPQAAEVRAYADALAADLDLPLDYWDERLTTAMAERALLDAGTRRNRRKKQVDAIAAAMILQSYLDAQRGRRWRSRRQETTNL
jgi:putative Holliday junction resolvase